MKCLLLEAGHWFNRHTYPRHERDGNSQLFWGGGIGCLVWAILLARQG